MPNAAAETPWFLCFNSQSRGQMRLFGFPHAAGSPALFSRWPGLLPPEVQVWGASLPGRGNRLREPPCERLSALVEGMGQAIVPLLDRPFAFYGHSMGTLVGFELARWLRRRGHPQPAHLFASSRAAPHLPYRRKPLHQLPEAELLEELGRFNGTPKAILDNRELMQLLLPAIRADFAVLETYEYAPEPPFKFPITVFGSFEDSEITPDDLGAWREHTERNFVVRMLPGDHFFIETAQASLLALVRQELGGIFARAY